MASRLTALALLSVLLLATTVQATPVGGYLASDTTWTKAESPYELTDNVTVAAGATLTVEAGVSVVVQGNYRLYVNGAVQADGTADHRVLFQALDPGSRGAWGGLYVAAGGQCRLRYATLRNAATDLTAVSATLELTGCALTQAQEDGLMAWGSTALTATESQFDSNGRRGLYLEGYEVTGTVSDCQFRQNGEYPVWLKATAAEILRGANRYAGNGVQRVAVSCSLATDITDTDLWTAQGVDFDLSAGGGEHVLAIAATGSLALARGAQVRASAIDVSGVLTALGEATRPCRLLSPRDDPAPGDWEGVTLRAGSRANLYWLELAHAQTGLTADGATLRLWDSTVRDCQYDGVRLTGASVANLRRSRLQGHGRYGLKLEGRELSGLVKNCQLDHNGSYPVWTMAQAVELLRNPNSYSGNATQAIAVTCGDDPDLATGTHLWTTQPVPLDLTAGDPGGALNVGAGATLIVSPDLRVLATGVDVRGRLEVRGTSSRPVYFGPRSITPSPGDWAGLSLTGATGSLTGAIVEYAAVGVALTNSSVPLRECVIRHSQYDGLRCRGAGCQPLVTTSQFLANGRNGVLIENNAWPSLGDLGNTPTGDDGGNRLAGNSAYDLCNDTANLIMAQGNWWSSGDSAAIAAHIYDQADDALRGRVRFDPFRGTEADAAPVLTWSRLEGYQNDGVNPELGPPTTLFRFQVQYSDAEATPPTSLVVHVAAGGAEIPGSPFALDRGSGTDFARGVIYFKGLTLTSGRNYTYWFSASDGQNAAVGTPTTDHAGPLVNSAPLLVWAKQGAWDGDGVDPDAGLAGTLFRFRCRYKDADGDAPVVLRCHLELAGVPVTGSPFPMARLTGTDFVAGANYELRRRLDAPGTYTYRFEASDGVDVAGGPASRSTAGPVVAASAAAAGQTLTVRATRGGLVAIGLRVSAPAKVTLEVINLAGRVVAHPALNLALDAGSRTLLWEGKTVTGTAAPGGQYLARATFARSDGGRQVLLTPFTYRR